MTAEKSAFGKPARMARCCRCDDHLFVRSDGKVYCGSPVCDYHSRAHPTGKTLNSGTATVGS